MRISLCGAAGEVTGSGYLVETSRSRVLVDFGLFQGSSARGDRNRDLGPVRPEALDAVVLTHAHLDHSGRLPLLLREGFRGRVHATEATVDLAGLLLRDSAHLMQSDAERRNRHRERRGLPAHAPLYGPDDVEALDAAFHVLGLDQPREVADGVTARLFEAGHMLGSASVELTVREGGRTRVLLFSGDLGPIGMPFLRDPAPPPAAADLVFLESTYGDRDHRPLDQSIEELAEVLEAAIKGRARVLVPAFSVGRSQQLIYHIDALVRAGRIPPVPVYLDSPMAIKATAIYGRHHELFDAEAHAQVQRRQPALDYPGLHLTATASESQALNNLRDAAVIIAGAGMCEGGRIVHHLRHNLWRPYVHVVFVGYQAEGTLGSRIVRGDREVRILGEPIAVKARIHTIGGFSGHAGQTELLDWLGHVAPAGPRVVLTHGETRQRDALAAAVRARFALDAERPEPHATLNL